MFDWGEVVIQQERHQDFLLEAERLRLIRQALAGHEKRDGVHRRALTWLGGQLVTWGCILESRYGVTAETSTVRPMGCAIKKA